MKLFIFIQMATEMEHIYEEKMATLVKESAAMKEEYESILVESEDQFKEQDSQYETERLKVDKLQDEIDQINSHSARQQELRQLEIKILEESVKSAKEQMESKDKYAVSKVAEVKSEREKVAKLESKVKILEDCSQQSELDAAAVVDELNLKLDRGTALKAKLEEERDRIVAESSKTMDKLQHKISSLESEFTDLKGEIVSKDSQLEHRQATVDSLMTVKGELEKKILSYRGDLETLMAAYDETKEEYSKNVREMKVDMDRDSSKFKSEYTELQIIATDSQEELEKLAASNDALQLTIAERTKTIEDLIRCSKDIEKEKAQAKSMLASVQERWQNHLKESEEFKRRATQLRIEKENEINSQLDTLDIVMTEKEELERKVQHLETKLEETKKQVKTTAELMAENYLLQDKIDRQDAFLKRKLLKEKVMKERMIPANPSSHPSLKSPPRVSSTRNISNRSRSTSTSRRSLDAPVPMPRQMSRQRSSSSRLDLRPIPSIDGLELQRSASDELDDLLNDDDGEV
jgi:chromosome segregation ATPase